MSLWFFCNRNSWVSLHVLMKYGRFTKSFYKYSNTFISKILFGHFKIPSSIRQFMNIIVLWNFHEKSSDFPEINACYILWNKKYFSFNSECTQQTHVLRVRRQHLVSLTPHSVYVYLYFLKPDFALVILNWEYNQARRRKLKIQVKED